MRIKTQSDLLALSPAAQNQISTKLQLKNTKSTLAMLAKDTAKNTRKSRFATDTESGAKYCKWPSPDTAVLFHIALEKRYGRYSDGGFIVSEMIIPDHQIAFRYDWAHLGAKITFEFDGFEAHRRLDDFNKDRVKHRHALQKGWLNVPVTNRDVRYDLIDLMEQVDKIILTRGSYDAYVKNKGMTQCIWIET
jgi:hypothetical protein